MDRKVLIIYCGGTFGMWTKEEDKKGTARKEDKKVDAGAGTARKEDKKADAGAASGTGRKEDKKADAGAGKLEPQPLKDIKKFIEDHSKLYDHFAKKTVELQEDGCITLYQQLCEDDPEDKSTAKADDKERKIFYKFDSLQNPKDSSSAGPEDWIDLTEKIRDNLKKYDGFVVIHGTDTMAFISSALSFLLGNIEKPVIVTGAQLPIFNPRSDGLCNLIDSLLIAGCYSDEPVLHKVMLCYQRKLYQGNRVMKVDCDSFSVFDSPEVCPIASLETTIKLMKEMQLSSAPRTETVEFMLKKVPAVRMLKFSPGITEEGVRGVLHEAEGVILETFGNGNVPEEEWLRKLLIDADKNNVLMLNCTQVLRGRVASVYAASKILTEANVIPGYDITPVAGMTKMVWVLKLNVNHQKRCEIMNHSVYGESCAPTLKFNLKIEVKK
ncbi:L-asparaginase 1 isoform X4 [Astyanax mexicanus]|uniref:L-asparaginase 1 isoform X3 n=1 Tax=Astyanax mexicanus TaxID=7994 RepID=UPI0020CAD8B9|nr:L-asparaginase 1 isoform X3 [Astyanax mexicanus]XP_022541487.2 L-asparaginase 1 isoform X4 [Astyanax mexicanus]